MSKEHVALVGLMGCGKSTVGALVARRKKMRFVDLDGLIVGRYGSIPDIFARQGEQSFRRYEYELLSEVLADEPAMISTGGGVLTHLPSRELLAGVTTIYLDVSVRGIVRRLARSTNVRPLIGAEPTEARVAELYEARRDLYLASTYRVDAERDVNVVVASVLRLLKK